MVSPTGDDRIVRFRIQRGVLVAELGAQPLIARATIGRIEEEIVQRLPDAASAILIDCQQSVGIAPSPFLNMLVRLHRLARPLGIRVAVCNGPAVLQESLAASGLHDVLHARGARKNLISQLQQRTDTPGASSRERDGNRSHGRAVGFEQWGGVLIARIQLSEAIRWSDLDDIQRQLLSQLPMARRGVIIDCRHLTGAVGSAFLAVLVGLAVESRRRGVCCICCCLPPQLTTQLCDKGLQSVIEMAENEETALQTVLADSLPGR